MSSGDPRPQAESPTFLSGVLAYLGRSYLTVGMLVVGVGLIVAILISLSGFSGAVSKDADAGKKTDPLEEARQQLEHAADVGVCRAALQQINAAPAGRPDDQSASVDAEALKRLTHDLNLNEDDGAEVAADAFTVLDGQYLAGAFLFRDAAARALEPQLLGADVPSQDRPTPLQRATAAFHWAVRQVRLTPPTLADRLPLNAAVAPTPPQYTLRRGSGTALERALVFLDLLDQVNAVGPQPLRVADVDTAGKRITVRDDAGKRQTIAADDARIRVDGAAGKGVEDIKADMWVAAESDGRTTTAIDAWSAAPPPALLGCLVFCDGREAPDHPWACGVLVNGRPDVYLFDPLLGLPIPGEGGEGVATLADVVHKPGLLQQLQVEGAPPYDVTAQKAAGARLQLVYSQSAVAPRMRRLQEKVLPPVRVSVYHDAELEKSLWEGAAKTSGAPAVAFWADGPALLRRFLPPEEGGSDKGSPFPMANLKGYAWSRNPQNQLQAPAMHRLELYGLELAPWDVLPPTFQDADKFPPEAGLGQRVRLFFREPFLRLLLEPQGPRDLLLRGDFDKAAEDLIGVRAHMEQEQKRIVDERKLLADAQPPQTLEGEVDQWWSEKALPVFGQQALAQREGTAAARAEADRKVEAVWAEAMPVRVLLQGASSVPGAAEVTYQLGLCKHDKAERAQARLDALRRQLGADVPPAEVEDVTTAWMDALGWWNKYGDDHPEEDANRLSTTPGRAAAVRRMRARAQAMLGEWQAAAATCEDRKEPAPEPLERLAALYLARQLKKAHAADK